MSITVSPTTFDLGKIEEGQSTTSFFSISTPDNVSNVSVTSNSQLITLRKGFELFFVFLFNFTYQ